MKKTKEQCIAEIMKCVDKMTLEQREKFLAYLRTLHEKEEAGKKSKRTNGSPESEDSTVEQLEAGA